ncbi:GntR family transcriptional regulator [Klebsiella pneumoniae subsp. pneumoniae]|nr:GntR family transcriptional regulator [Klebsiella pneumoniae subsp. pneumoniae]
MSLLTSRYGLGVGPLREALSQLVAERLVTVGQSERLSGGAHVGTGASRYLRRARQHGGHAGASRH